MDVHAYQPTPLWAKHQAGRPFSAVEAAVPPERPGPECVQALGVICPQTLFLLRMDRTAAIE
jgi:hypothetical protein